MGNRYTKVTNIKDVRRGDHVSYKNGWFYHHAIVVEVDIPENTLTVVHYLHNGVGSKSDASKYLDHPAISYSRVREEVIDYGLYATRDKLYRYLYEDHECVGPEEVLFRAKSHLDKTRFNVQYNNCEDFAMRCKTSAALQAAQCPSGSGVGALALQLQPGLAGIQGLTTPPVQMPGSATQGQLSTGGLSGPPIGSAPGYITCPSGDIIGAKEEKSKLYDFD